MLISENIQIDVDAVLHEIYERQGLPWNSGRINDYNSFDALNKLFAVINSGIPKEDFMYSGDLFRIHTAYHMLSEQINPSKERLIGKVCDDDSCAVLPLTHFTERVVAFSKSPDFTRSVFYKVHPSQQAVIFHVDSGALYGIDVNAFYHRFGGSNDRFADEKEVLFPLTKETLIKEYHCTPRQFKQYMRRYTQKGGN